MMKVNLNKPSILKDYQVKRAEAYLKEHESGIFHRASKVYGKYPPFAFVDEPQYWNDENWKWYLEYRKGLSFLDQIAE